MIRHSTRLAFIITVLAASMAIGSPRASACSGGLTDHWAAADLVVLARVVSLEMLTGDDAGGGEPGYPVRITAEVRDSLKGDAPARVSWEERWASGDPEADPSTWTFSGGGGDCSTLRENPLGKYTLAFLSRGRDGDLQLGGPIVGYSPDPDRFEEIRARYARPSGMPRTGGGGTESGSPLAVALLLGGSVAVAVRLRGFAARTAGE